MATHSAGLRRPAAAPLVEPLSPRRKWRAITVATLMLVPAYWLLLAGIVGTASASAHAGPAPGAGLAFGLAVIPFVFIVLAVMSEHPRWPSAVLKAMALAVLVGVPASALAADAVTGIVAGIGAGGVVALRADEGHSWRARAVAVVLAAAYTLVLVRLVSVLALLPAPVFPFTAVGLADAFTERRHARTTD